MFSLFAQEEREVKRQTLHDPLVVLNQHIDFSMIAAAIEYKINLGKSKHGGRPPYPTILMIKLLLLQQLYHLSDDALEYHVLDRMSFQRFLGLEKSGKVPDAKTIWLWRERLNKQDLMGDISAAISLQLQQAGYIARGGQMIDATLISAPVQRNTREENKKIKQDEKIEDWSPAKRSQKDVDARWVIKNEVRHYGYKLHVNADKKWKFIRHYQVTSANVHDSQVLEEILDPCNTGKHIYADSAYAFISREHALKKMGYRVDIQHKGTRNKPLSKTQQQRNHRISKSRARVEHVFGRMSQMGGKGIRSIGLLRAKVTLGLKVGIYNLQRLATLKKNGIIPV